MPGGVQRLAPAGLQEPSAQDETVAALRHLFIKFFAVAERLDITIVLQISVDCCVPFLPLKCEVLGADSRSILQVGANRKDASLKSGGSDS